VIWDEVMWYAYVDMSEIKMVEYYGRERELAQNRFKGVDIFVRLGTLNMR